MIHITGEHAMSEMIERVARALFADHWQNDPELIPIAWEDASDWLHDAWHRSARAAIEEMREMGMVVRDGDGLVVHELRGAPNDIWRHMIDAALNTTTPERA